MWRFVRKTSGRLKKNRQRFVWPINIRTLLNKVLCHPVLHIDRVSHLTHNVHTHSAHQRSPSVHTRYILPLVDIHTRYQVPGTRYTIRSVERGRVILVCGGVVMVWQWSGWCWCGYPGSGDRGRVATFSAIFALVYICSAALPFFPLSVPHSINTSSYYINTPM